MKKYNYILIIVLGLFFTNNNILVAQQLSDENTYVINQYFQSSKEISSKLIDSKPIASTNNIQVHSNVVSLKQIGNNNEIDIKQKGIDSQTINQLGNNNSYNFINFYNNSPSNFNILQQGNSNSLQIYGENSIIKNIGIVQKSDFNTLIIKNY